jgi:uncharacterized membrane protein YkvA (DUF1232 family)
VTGPWRERLRREAAELLADVGMLARAMFDPEAPWHVRVLVFLIVAYVVSPVDFIPDFIPVLGLLDEIILVPLALRLARRLLPPALVERYRQAPAGEGLPPGVKIAGAVLIVTLWLVLIALAVAAMGG